MATIYLRYSGVPSVSISEDLLNFPGKTNLLPLKEKSV